MPSYGSCCVNKNRPDRVKRPGLSDQRLLSKNVERSFPALVPRTIGGEAAQQRRGPADRGKYCEAAGAVAEAVIRSVELIVQADADSPSVTSVVGGSASSALLPASLVNALTSAFSMPSRMFCKQFVRLDRVDAGQSPLPRIEAFRLGRWIDLRKPNRCLKAWNGTYGSGQLQRGHFTPFIFPVQSGTAGGILATAP